MLVYTLEEDEKPVIMVGKKARFVTPSALDHQFRFFALDQASTPLSKELKKRQLLELLPVLGQLGVPQEKLLEDVVRAFELNESYIAKADASSTGSASRAASAEVVPPEPTTDAQALAQELLGSVRSTPLPMP